jgi:cytochrome c nitrite reductase small subunit
VTTLPFSRRALLLTALAAGVLLGLGAFTFIYAEGLSYFGTDAKACANCHIMNPQYDSWIKSSHHIVATCADCHLPQATVPKFYAKALNGYHHSKGFTFQDLSDIGHAAHAHARARDVRGRAHLTDRP